MLIFQIKRIISSEKLFNQVVTFFFFGNAKNLGQSDNAKWRKKEDGLTCRPPQILRPSMQAFFFKRKRDL